MTETVILVFLNSLYRGSSDRLSHAAEMKICFIQNLDIFLQPGNLVQLVD